MRIGLISDTHGLLRPEAVQAMTGVGQIIHAGDIGGPEIIEGLRRLAPVHAVRGNNDRGGWANLIPPRLGLELGGVRICVLHDVHELDADANAQTAEFGVVIAGHSHKPGVVERDGVLFVNPGSAGPRRFTLPITVGYLIVAGGTARAEIRELL
ncbi:MAG TPA: metallophosphoesterase family protein [Steroidobacteraceae bacterium]|nr:metallophosphoesterase family protein [Steroidobacteraceae bacterium]